MKRDNQTKASIFIAATFMVASFLGLSACNDGDAGGQKPERVVGGPVNGDSGLSNTTKKPVKKGCESNRECVSTMGAGAECLYDSQRKRRKCVAKEDVPLEECFDDIECHDAFGARGICKKYSKGKTRCVALAGDDGTPCKKDSECTGGVCLNEDIWKGLGGSCTTLDCQTDKDCAGENGAKNSCVVVVGKGSLCLNKCQPSILNSCRKGFACVATQQTAVNVCVPDDSPVNTMDDNFGVTCKDVNAGEQTISMKLSPNMVGYAFSAWLENYDAKLDFVSFSDGTRKILRKNASDVYKYAKLFLSQVILPETVSIFFPDTPKLKSFVEQPAERTATVVVNASSKGKMCYRLTEKPAKGQKVELNVYLVGVKSADGSHDLTAAEAEKDPNVAELFKEVNRIYGQQGMSVHVRQYKELPDSVVKRYRYYNAEKDVTKGYSELRTLFRRSEVPGTTVDDVMSVNIFLVEDIAGGQVVGISGGIPGMPGIHGVSDSGLVFTTHYLHLGVGNHYSTGFDVKGTSFTAHIVAHELAHYLGLFHTSEVKHTSNVHGYNYDPFSDTDECDADTIRDDLATCGDIRNLMFPMAVVPDPIISPQQADVMKRNPLMR